MAKNFPYFKFVVTDWMTGDIVYEELSVQGLFINVCALYWQRDAQLCIEDVNHRFKNPKELAILTDRFISVLDGQISIKFLDEQLIEAGHISKVNSKNGKKGGRPKVAPPKEEKPVAYPIESEIKPSKEEVKKNESKEELELKKSKVKIVAESPLAYTECVDFWLKDFHFGWTFDGAKGNAMKSILKKIESLIKSNNDEITKELIVDSFKLICKKLPEFFKNKDLEIINQKFNEIISEIKNPTTKNGNKISNAELLEGARKYRDNN